MSTGDLALGKTNEILDVEALLREHDVPGCSIAVLEGGRIVEERAVGRRAANRDESVTTATMFQACSISKPVSVFGAMLLVAEGALDLDEQVDDRLQAWQVPPVGAWKPRVTLRHLASHSAGLTVSGFAGYRPGFPLPTTPQILMGMTPANTPGVRVSSMPGLGFRYSGGGTTVIQQLLEDVTGSPAAQFLRRLVLEPLDMHHSTFTQITPDLGLDTALGHYADGSPLPGGWQMHPELCAAGLWSTPGDLLRFAMGLQSAFGGSSTLLRQNLAQDMLSPQVRLDGDTARAYGCDAVGLGPFLRMREGDTAWFEHSGGNAGYRCHVIASTRTGQGAAVMTNGHRGGAVVSQIIRAIATAYSWDDLDFPLEADDPHLDLEALGLSDRRFRTGTGTVLAFVEVPEGVAVVVEGQSPLPLFPTAPGELMANDIDLTIRIDGLGGVSVSFDGHTETCTLLEN